MVEGMVPKIELVPIENFVMHWKKPISDGSMPAKERPLMSIDKTLA